MMTAMPTFSHRVRVVLHIIGLSFLGGALFLQILVFAGILQHGYFMAVEQNPAVLTFEIIATAFAVIYFSYVFQRIVR